MIDSSVIYFQHRPKGRRTDALGILLHEQMPTRDDHVFGVPAVPCVSHASDELGSDLAGATEDTRPCPAHQQDRNLFVELWGVL
jgi:hypothetical protein